MKQPIKRHLLRLVAVLPWLTSCASSVAGKEDPRRRFAGIGIVLVDDAVLGSEMRNAAFMDDRGVVLLAPSLVSRQNKKFMVLDGARVPLSLKVVWREGAGWDEKRRLWNEGRIVGDYTIPVAERIPDEVLDDIRAKGGALRLKFRLKPDGVLFGWDIERSLPIPGCDPAKNATCRGTYFFSLGGDFLETRY